jgi:thiamine-monophosphate kinase
VTVSHLTESELVARIQSRLPPGPPWVAVGIGDDAAVVEAERNRLEVLTTDIHIEGIHFDRRFTPPRAIGHRALAVNLSDLAAMGAAPRLALLSLALPDDFPVGDFDALIGGAASLARRAGATVIGGNLSRSPGPLVVDVTVGGTVKRRHVLTRSGASPGDELFVTGTIGAASRGLQLLRDGGTVPCGRTELKAIRRFLYPEPRLRAGLLLGRTRAASACVDLSDGLAAGLHTLSEASGIGVQVEEAAIPLDAPRHFTSGAGALEAMTGGDDYELLFAVRPRLRGRMRNVVASAGAPVTRIGVCTTGGDRVVRRSADGRETLLPLPGGFTHFAGSS